LKQPLKNEKFIIYRDKRKTSLLTSYNKLVHFQGVFSVE
jgi:hypothetical protein